MSSRDQGLKAPLLSDEVLNTNSTSSQKWKRSLTSPLLGRHNNLEETPKPKFEIQKPRAILMKAMLVFGIYVGVGIICFFMVSSGLEGFKTNSIVDALYFCVVTMTTVGYGDLVPSGDGAKILTCAFVFLGLGVAGFLLGSVVDYLFEKEESFLVQALNANKENVSYEEFSKLFQSNKACWKVVVSGVSVLALFLIGVGVLVGVEGLRLVDAFYTVCVTVTTLGYGDESFHTTGGRVFAIIWILVSTISVAQLFLYITELQIERTRNPFIKRVLTRKTTSDDLEAADIDCDRRVSGAEFVIYKLKEMGKIDEDDVKQILKVFYKQDVDVSGFLTHSDLCNIKDGET